MLEKILFILCALTLVKNGKTQQLVSPCPRLFTYEPRNSETDRWYGNVVLLSDSELTGIWLRVIFDKPSTQLGNWFGEVVTTDNTEYLIKNRNFKLQPNQPYTLRFYLKYNPSEAPPQLVRYRLNAKTVCPEGGSTTQASVTLGQLITSNELSTTSAPVPVNPVTEVSTEQNGNVFQQNRPPTTEDDDYFQGDFNWSPNRDQTNNNNNFEAACGTVIIPPKPLITHGQGTNEGEFPWHAALYHSRGIDLTYICGASLINKQYLVTVAHCVTKPRSQAPINPENLVIYLGKYYLKRWANPGIQDRQIEKIIAHPNYNSQSYSNDIAVLKLSSPAEITNYVRPICLWEDNVNLEHVISKHGTVVGWGFDETGKVTEQLTKAQMPVVSLETCIYSFPEFYSRFTSSKTFCAGFQNGTSVCNGDSGGGMVFPKRTSPNGNSVWQLRGLVSISVALQNQYKCDSKHYVVFTDVAKYLDWIRTSMAS